MPGGLYGRWRRSRNVRVADLTTLVARIRDTTNNYEAVLELAQFSGAKTARQMVELIAPTGGTVTPGTFDHICAALEFIEKFPRKEKA